MTHCLSFSWLARHGTLLQPPLHFQMNCVVLTNLHGVERACRDKVVIITGDFSQSAIRTLELDGWLVHKAQTVQNPRKRDDGQYPARFWAVYTKLNVFGLTQYHKGGHTCAPLLC